MQKKLFLNSMIKSIGLSDLISTCYKKGEKSYKIAIKNSLEQIAKDYFLNNIQNLSNKIKKILIYCYFWSKILNLIFPILFLFYLKK